MVVEIRAVVNDGKLLCVCGEDFMFRVVTITIRVGWLLITIPLTVIGFFLAFFKVKNSSTKKGYEQGVMETTAVYEAKTKELREKLFETLSKLQDTQGYYKGLLAMYTVASSVSNLKGQISQEDIDYIDVLIGGVSKERLPQEVKYEIEKILNNPLKISAAFDVAKKSGVEIKIFDEIVEIISSRSSQENGSQQEVFEMWCSLNAG